MDKNFNIYYMDKKILEKYIESGLSTREISKKVDKSQSSVRYWLKKYKFKTILSKGSDLKKCCKCGEVKNSSEFYVKTGSTLQPYCKPCLLIIQKERWLRLKEEAIKYKGGKCVDCGISYPEEPLCVFEFHHLYPKEKKYNWNKMKLVSNSKRCEELDKCILLCSNCHKKRHWC